MMTNVFPFRTLRTAVVAVLALHSTAFAMPKQYRGTWCGVNDSRSVLVRSRGASCPDRSGDNLMQITANGFNTYESECQHRGSIKNAPILRVKFYCASKNENSQDDSWASILILRLGNGRLFVNREN
jgi:hypothetical protein